MRIKLETWQCICAVRWPQNSPPANLIAGFLVPPLPLGQSITLQVGNKVVKTNGLRDKMRLLKLHVCKLTCCVTVYVCRVCVCMCFWRGRVYRMCVHCVCGGLFSIARTRNSQPKREEPAISCCTLPAPRLAFFFIFVLLFPSPHGVVVIVVILSGPY